MSLKADIILTPNVKKEHEKMQVERFLKREFEKNNLPFDPEAFREVIAPIQFPATFEFGGVEIIISYHK